jgi:hypothetical protein
MVTQGEAIAVHQSPGTRSVPVTGTAAHEAHPEAVDSNGTSFQGVFGHSNGPRAALHVVKAQ